MTNLTDARILYRTWAQSFDPSSSGSLDRLASPSQEAWLYIAATARMLSSEEDTPPPIVPGLLYLATWTPSARWGNKLAPQSPQLYMTFFPEDDRLGGYVVEQERGGFPTLTYISTIPEKLRRIPGMIYPPFPPL
jgi:hypothetical protein